MKIGDTLPNGSVLLGYKIQNGDTFVMCNFRPGCSPAEYVVWRLDLTDLSCHGGQYCKDDFVRACNVFLRRGILNSDIC